jgi:hypothetical protein
MRKVRQLLNSVLLVSFSFGANADWFGPDNYEECVLEKMKGQPKEMMWTAQTACEKKFSFEKELYDYSDDLEINWVTSGSNIYLVIEENTGEYTVTRYEAKFSTKKCSELTSAADYSLTEVFRFPEGEHRSYVSTPDSENYKCMRTETIWGRYRN